MSSAELATTVERLWPGGRVQMHRGRESRSTAPGVVAEFALVPSASAPRLLVPLRDRRAAARSMLRFSAGATATDVASRVAGAAWLRLGGARGLPDRLSVTGDRESSLQGYLSWLFDTEVTFTLGIGTARVNRKPVLQVFGADGRTLAFVKLGVGAVSRRDVRAEAAALRSLEGVAWEHLEIPRVRHLGAWGDVVVLVLSPLASAPRARRERPPRQAMRELGSTFAEEPAPLAGLPWFARMRDTADRILDPGAATTLHRCMDALERTAGGRKVAVGAWHGDWTPWNMSGAHTRVRLWDWERFEAGVPRGLDLVHFVVNTATRDHGTSPATVAAALARLDAGPDRAGTEQHLVASLYLLAVTARYLPLAEGERGRDIAPRARCTLGTLADRIGVPA